MSYDTIPTDEIIQKTVTALEQNGIHAILVENGAAAKQKLLEFIPEGAEVFNNTSTTLNQIGATDEILKSGKFKPIREKFTSPDATELEKQQWGAAPEYATGSVHAITEDGHILIASATGSQLPSYLFGASHVVWIAGAHKIVANMDEAMARLQEYVFPREDARAMQAYGTHSSINKLAIINKEVKPGRINLILVKEVLGF